MSKLHHPVGNILNGTAPRRKPRQWKRFFFVELGEFFTVGRGTKERRLRKISWCFSDDGSRTSFLNPWTRVHTDRPVKKSEQVLKSKSNSGRDITHYVGDNCPGGHLENNGPDTQ